MQNNAIDNTVMRVNNKRKHAHQMRANARVRTRFSTRVYAKIVRAFCVCVGRLSLTCTVDMVVLQRGQGTSLILPCHCNDRSHEIALRLPELIALSPSLRADSLSVLWTLTCQVTGKNQRTNPWTHQRMEEVSSSMQEPVVWMVKVLRAEEKPAGHL